MLWYKSKKHSIGTTVIAQQIYPWSIGIKIDKEDWYIKYDEYIFNLREQNAVIYNRIANIIKDSSSNFQSEVLTGNIITSEAVVNNDKIKREAIERAYGCNIIAGEMEGYGLAKECMYYTNSNCLIIKSICDWGSIKNIDNYINIKKSHKDYKGVMQAYASYCAYTVLKEFFNRNIFENSSIYNYTKEKIYVKFFPVGFVFKKDLYRYLNKELNGINKECDAKTIDKVISHIILELKNDNYIEEITEDKYTGYKIMSHLR